HASSTDQPRCRDRKRAGRRSEIQRHPRAGRNRRRRAHGRSGFAAQPRESRMTLYLQISVLMLSYLLGGIPFGFLLTKVAGYGDIRQIGSGNIGATNVLRTGNKKLAALTLLLDGGKGTLAVLLVQQIFPDFAPLAGLAVLVGHLLPIWLDF